ncbi:phage portal protein [Rhodococcoides fascians]|uniref:phage portal protein n=1 Tax=Rhodococcoides fascians TaxID=1828 RepID=UPI000568EE97|nr:phage portal protein [Rhodococcus fascians]
MVVFQSLDGLSAHLESSGATVDFPDAGVPLTDLTGSKVNEAAVLRNQPSVRKVTSFIAAKVSAVPVHLHRRISDTDRERVTDHPLTTALREPVPRMTSVRFWHDVMMDRLIHDRYCIVWGYDDDRLTLTRIPARRTKFYGDGLGSVTRIRVAMPDGSVVKLDPSQCVIDVGYSVGSSANGLSPIETLSHILQESAEAVEYRRSVWENGARIPQVVRRPASAPNWSKEARSRFMRGLEAYRKGGGKEGKWLLLEDDMEISGSSASAFRPKDTLDLEGRKLTDIEVAAAYHVPPELVGSREGTYSNIDAFQKMLYGPVLGHHFIRNEQAINTQLVPAVSDDADPIYAEYAIEAMMRGSFIDQAKVGQTVVGRPTMTVNEWRARMNMPRVDGGDELIVPMNVTVGGQASPTDVEGRPAGDE